MGKRVVLIILDGIGLNNNDYGNAVFAAAPEYYEFLLDHYPFLEMEACGEPVGLPAGQMGNSEVGHLNIGAGHVVNQELLSINKLIKSGDFFRNVNLVSHFLNVKKKGSGLHLLGLVSDGGVHSHEKHLYALLDLAYALQLPKVWVHCITDGRDTNPHEAEKFIARLQEKIKDRKNVEIATVMGRYYAMDRDKVWTRTKKAFDAISSAKGYKVLDPIKFVRQSAEKGIYDEFVEPCVCSRNYYGIEENDAIMFFNFRSDRTRQLCFALKKPQFMEFFRTLPRNFELFSLTDYGDTAKEYGIMPILPIDIAHDTLTEVVSKAGKKILKVAETTKFPHVTYFFNGRTEVPFNGEDRILIPSSTVRTFNLEPRMRAAEIASVACDAIRIGLHDLIVINFANGDMVGHSGDFEATKEAIHHVDMALGKVVDCARQYGAVAIVTADHGNAEEMLGANGEVLTAHTLNKVAFVVCDKKLALVGDAPKLANIAPTILDIMDIEKPKSMTESSLLAKFKKKE